MTSLQAVSTYLPAESVTAESILRSLELSDKQIKLYERFYGYSRIRKNTNADVMQLMLSAAENLEALHGREKRIRYVIGARTIQMAAPYPHAPLRDVCSKLGLDHAIAFVVSQHACASGLLAFYLADRLLASDGDLDGMALVFTGEKTFSPATQVIRDTAVMGESSAAFLVRCGGEHDRMLSYATHSMGKFSSAPFLTAEEDLEFRSIYTDTLAKVLLAAANRAGAGLADIALILPHNVNQISWMRVCKVLGFPLDRVFLENIGEIGHCFCADTFINYETACKRRRLQEGDIYIMASVGLGATFSAMVFQH